MSNTIQGSDQTSKPALDPDTIETVEAWPALKRAWFEALARQHEAAGASPADAARLAYDFVVEG